MGRLLGIDHGDRRIGLALSDPSHLIATPFRTLAVRSAEAVLSELRALIAEWEVERIVIGLPLGMRHRETARTTVVRSFAEQVRTLGLPVELIDERLSSVSATKSLVQRKIKTGHNKELVDRTAAAIILQQYLDGARS